MKCNYCNQDVADGTNFCPNCGNKIEFPQSLKCPQCNTEVTESTNFCPNCGNPIGVPQPRKCSKCGAELEDDEKFCSNCGTPVEGGSLPHSDRVLQNQAFSSNSQPHSNNMNSIINVVWDDERGKPLWNNPINVYVNNQKCGEFSPKGKFEMKFPISSTAFNLQLEYGKGPFNKTDINLNLEYNQSYVLYFFLNSLGTFGFALKDGHDRLIKEDGDISLAMVVLFLLIPLVGFVFYFIKNNLQPLSAKAGLLCGLGNIILIFLWYLF